MKSHIFHFITSLEGGGAQRALATLLLSRPSTSEGDGDGVTPACPESRHSIYYIHGGPYVQKLQDAGYHVEQVRGWLHPYDPFLFIRLFFLLRRTRPALLHTSLVAANVLGRVVGWLLRIPVLCDLHSDVRFHGWARNFLERLTARLPARYVAVSNTVRDAFLGEMRGLVPAEKVQVIYNGVDIDEIQRQAQSVVKKESLGIPEDSFVIGAVGRLEKIKRYDLLIEAHALLCNEERAAGQPLPHLVIIGAGSQEAALKRMAGEAYVHFLGWQNNVYCYYPLFDCTVFSSDSEGISFALLESLAGGTPVVTTHTEPEHEVVQSIEQGVVVQPGSAEALAQGIASLKKSGRRKKPLLSHSFSCAAMKRGYERIYETLR